MYKSQLPKGKAKQSKLQMESDHQLKEKPEFDLMMERRVGKMDQAAAGFGIGCVKHPYHHQRQGVCPYCLREKLSQLHDSYNLVASSKLMVAPPSPSSYSLRSNSPPNYSGAFGRVSPSRSWRHHHRNVSDVLGSISFRLSGGGGLRKSRSIAFASRNLGGEVKNRGKNGFWSKLRHHLKGKKEDFVHSMPMKESTVY